MILTPILKYSDSPKTIVTDFVGILNALFSGRSRFYKIIDYLPN